MSEAIEKVPAETRWEIATKGLTGACTAILNDLKGAEGEEKYNEINKELWYEAGKGAKEFADTFGLATENAGDVEGVTHLLALTSMGPEFKFEVVESTEDRCVGKTTGCPWHKRWKELGLDFDFCSSGHQAWGDGATERSGPLAKRALMCLFAFSKVFRFGILSFIPLLAINTGSLCRRKSNPELNCDKRWNSAVSALRPQKIFTAHHQYYSDVLLLEATPKNLKRLVKRMDAGRDYFPLLDAEMLI